VHFEYICWTFAGSCKQGINDSSNLPATLSECFFTFWVKKGDSILLSFLSYDSGWRPSMADSGGGMSADCTTGWFSCSLARAVDGRIVRCGMINSRQINCHLRDCKALLVMSLTHASSAVSSIGFLPFFCKLNVADSGSSCSCSSYSLDTSVRWWCPETRRSKPTSVFKTLRLESSC